MIPPIYGDSWGMVCSCFNHHSISKTEHVLSCSAPSGGAMAHWIAGWASPSANILLKTSRARRKAPALAQASTRSGRLIGCWWRQLTIQVFLAMYIYIHIHTYDVPIIYYHKAKVTSTNWQSSKTHIEAKLHNLKLLILPTVLTTSFYSCHNSTMVHDHPSMANHHWQGRIHGQVHLWLGVEVEIHRHIS